MLTAFLTVFMTLGDPPGRGPMPKSTAAVQAVGIGYPPLRMPAAQGQLMSRRAAEVAAIRNLALKLGVGPQGRLPSFRYVSTKYLLNGSVEVTVETTVPVGRNATASPTTKNGVRSRLQGGGRP